MKMNRIIMVVLLSVVCFPASWVLANKYDDALPLYKQKDYKGAITLLEDHCNQYPKDPRGGSLLAQCYLKEKQTDKAIERLKIVLEHHPEHEASQFLMGFCMVDQKKYSEAEKYLAEAVKLKPDDGDYQALYGSVLMNQKKYSEASPVLAKAVKLDPKNAKANFDYGRALILTGDYEASLVPLQAAANDNATKKAALYYLGTAQIQTQKYNEAVTTLLAASKETPDDAKVYYNLGIAYEGKLGQGGKTPDDFKPQIEAYKKSADLEKNNAEYLGRLGLSYEQAARTIYEKSAGNEEISKQALSLLENAKTSYNAALAANASSPSKDRVAAIDQMIENIKNPQEVEETVSP